MYYVINILTFLVLVSFCAKTTCECRHSYMTFCDSLKDFKNYNVENWTEVVVGKETEDSSEFIAIDSDLLDLANFPKLTSLIIVGLIKDVKSYTFGGLDEEDTNLDYVNLYGNEIPRIRFTTFDVVNLRKLNLVNNKIEYIHKGAFYNCRIRTIDLSNNLLETVENGVFTEDGNLIGNATKEIILRHNRIINIVSNSFPSSLEILNLDHNNLGLFGYTVFENLLNLKQLTFSHNKIKSLPGLKHLKEIEVIDASHNIIVVINAADFNELSQLRILDLSHNRLTYPLVFNKFNFPERGLALQISLAFNRLSHLLLQDDSFRRHIVFLYGNPWDCKCFAELEKFMADNNVKRNKCDLQFFGSGEVPYCIPYECNDCSKGVRRLSNWTSPEIENFLDVIKKRQDSVRCSLKPKRY